MAPLRKTRLGIFVIDIQTEDGIFRVPMHLENLENLENEIIYFQDWKSPRKDKNSKMCLKSPRNFLKSIFLEEIIDDKGYGSIFLRQIYTTLENVNFHLEEA